MRDSAEYERAGAVGVCCGAEHERRNGMPVARGGRKGEKRVSKSIKNERVLIVSD